MSRFVFVRDDLEDTQLSREAYERQERGRFRVLRALVEIIATALIPLQLTLRWSPRRGKSGRPHRLPHMRQNAANLDRVHDKGHQAHCLATARADGSYTGSDSYCRSADRASNHPDFRKAAGGFCVVVQLK